MSPYTYPEYNYSPKEYVYDDYGFDTSPPSFGAGGHAMTATNSSQSMSSTSSYATSPPNWEWQAQQQSNQYPIYNTTSSTCFAQSEEPAYFTQTEEPAYPSQTHYYQQLQDPQPAQETPRSQRGTTESVPTGLVCLVPGCETRGRFKRRADLARHMNTVHEVKQRHSCPRPRCDRKADRGFTRRDHLYEHLRNTHGVEISTGGEKRRRRGEAAA